MITAGSTVFCAVLPQQQIHLPAVVLAGVLACGFAVSKRRLSQRAEELAAKLDEAQKAAEKASEEERQRIASDFHDGPLQSFISLQMRLELSLIHISRQQHGFPRPVRNHSAADVFGGALR